jgi:hypothetical protein
VRSFLGSTVAVPRHFTGCTACADDEAYKLKNPVKSRIFGLDEAKNDEFTTDLPQLTQDTSEKKTLPAMAVFFYAPYFE